MITGEQREKNLKDSNLDLTSPLKDASVSLSYTKTNNLITALYMVTDIMDTAEPLRAKLRTFAVEIISDIALLNDSHIGHGASGTLSKIEGILSFLDIASGVNLISEMNRSILRKEFVELYASLKEYADSKQKSVLSQDFFTEDESAMNFDMSSFKTAQRDQTHQKNDLKNSIGHQTPPHRLPSTRIGVQNAGTFMKVLSDKAGTISAPMKGDHYGFDVLKRQRRTDLVSIIRTYPEGGTITDIRNSIKTKSVSSLMTCGEKTLQRELVAMVKDSLLTKTGEKRWSRYLVAA